MTDTTYTKDEAVNLRLAVQDIELFLRLATMRLENMPEYAPFKAKDGLAVLSWLRHLSTRYAQGVDISSVA